MYSLIFLNVVFVSFAVGQEVKIIEIKPTVDYKYTIIDSFDKGGNVESYTYAALQKAISKKVICDFQSSFHPQSKLGWGYVPAVCEEQQNCNGTFLESEYLNKTCEQQTRAKTVCCPINATTSFGSIFRNVDSPGDLKHFEFQEVPTDFKFFKSDYFVPAITGRNSEYVKSFDILDDVSQPTYVNRIRQELVCGFKKGRQIFLNFDTSTDLRNISNRMPFFCVRPEKCKPKEKENEFRKPYPEWNYLCQNMIKFTTEQIGKTACCHVEDIDEPFFINAFKPLPELPMYLKYAPGFRSSYKCEQYAKEVCKGKDKMCVEPPTKFNTVTNRGENFHFASLGFVVPKFMKFHCGGTLISIRYVLSSETCKSYFGFKTNMVYFGEYDSQDVPDPSTKHYQAFYIISEILPYQTSGFRLKSGEEPPNAYSRVDLALYRTAREVQLSPYVRPACLYYKNLEWPSELEFVGFGVNESHPAPLENPKNQYLTRLKLPALRRQLCESFGSFHQSDANPYYAKFGVKYEYMACYGSNQQLTNAPCKHDRGGPLHVRLNRPGCSIQLLGVLSSDKFICYQFEPVVFINVTKFIAEIEDEVWGDYTFLDVFDLDLVLPTCGNLGQFMFFNKCYGGVECFT